MALLHHSHFYQEMLVVFTNFYAQPTIQQISATELMISPHLSSASSESTMSTSGKPNHVKMRDWKLKFIKRIYDELICWTTYGHCDLKNVTVIYACQFKEIVCQLNYAVFFQAMLILYYMYIHVSTNLEQFTFFPLIFILFWYISADLTSVSQQVSLYFFLTFSIHVMYMNIPNMIILKITFKGSTSVE